MKQVSASTTISDGDAVRDQRDRCPAVCFSDIHNGMDIRKVRGFVTPASALKEIAKKTRGGALTKTKYFYHSGFTHSFQLLQLTTNCFVALQQNLMFLFCTLSCLIIRYKLERKFLQSAF